MNFSIFLFLIGILGFVLNRKNIILMLISIEIMLLSITFLILISSLSFDDILGQTFAIYIITIAGAESAIGLGILVAFYRLNLPNTKNKLLTLYYPSKLLSKRRSISLINNRYYSTESDSDSDPLFVTGFLDAESSFVVTILKNNRYKLGWVTQARGVAGTAGQASGAFQIKLHEKDRFLLLLLQRFLVI